jgi:hypothetical protein
MTHHKGRVFRVPRDAEKHAISAQILDEDPARKVPRLRHHHSVHHRPAVVDSRPVLGGRTTKSAVGSEPSAANFESVAAVVLADGTTAYGQVRDGGAFLLWVSGTTQNILRCVGLTATDALAVANSTSHGAKRIGTRLMYAASS